MSKFDFDKAIQFLIDSKTDENSLRKEFEFFDKDKDGVITSEELFHFFFDTYKYKVYDYMSQEEKEKDANKMKKNFLNSMDLNKDGKISFEEFVIDKTKGSVIFGFFEAIHYKDVIYPKLAKEEITFDEILKIEQEARQGFKDYLKTVTPEKKPALELYISVLEKVKIF